MTNEMIRWFRNSDIDIRIFGEKLRSAELWYGRYVNHCFEKFISNNYKSRRHGPVAQGKEPQSMEDTVLKFFGNTYMFWKILRTSLSGHWTKSFALTLLLFFIHPCRKHTSGTFIVVCIICFSYVSTKMLSETHLNLQLHFLGRFLHMFNCFLTK